jgi:glycine/D-amino acid oxidase-like deaminating enzyme
MPGYSASYWAERSPASRRRKYPGCRGPLSADVVVIGGGLTGAMAACVLARGGLDVIVLEADRVACGATARDTGLVLPQPSAPFVDITAALGLRATRTAWRETRASALDLVSTTRRLGITCDLVRVPLIEHARYAHDAIVLRKDQVARKDAGLTVPWLSSRALEELLGTESSGGIKLAEAAAFDPVRATLGFLRIAEKAGARIFERSPATRTRFTRQSAQVVLKGAIIDARGIYVATARPGTLFAQLRRHVREFASYTVVTEPLAGPMKRETGKRTTLVTEAPGQAATLRWLKDDRAMFTGAFGPAVSSRQIDKVLVQRTGELMYELSLRYPVISGLPARWSWTTPVVTTADGLPWVGPHRNYPFHFFALALGLHGNAHAWFAAKAALRHFGGKPRREDLAFAFTR